MHCHQHLNFFSPDHADSATQLFLRSFKHLSKEQRLIKVEHIILENNMDLIARCAHQSKLFKEVCTSEQFQKNWESNWCTFGIILSNDPSKLFYCIENQPIFELMLGAYFYHDSIKIAAASSIENSPLEMMSLQRAVFYKSIHAAQKYHQYLYDKIDSNTLSHTDIERYFNTIVEQIKTLIPLYGSYAYLMLTEAYLRYGIYFKESRPDFSKKTLTAATTASRYAQKYFKGNDSPEIFNASLGRTLAESNSMKLSNFDEIQNLIHSFQNDTHLQNMSLPSQA